MKVLTMRRACTLLISASVGLAIFSMVTLAQAPAQQGALLDAADLLRFRFRR